MILTENVWQRPEFCCILLLVKSSSKITKQKKPYRFEGYNIVRADGWADATLLFHSQTQNIYTFAC